MYKILSILITKNKVGMKIYNTKNIPTFNLFLSELGRRLNIEVDYNSISKNCFRVRLLKNKDYKNYQRIGFYNNKDGSLRKINAICWHGYRDFINELYTINENLRIVSAQATYLNKEDFLNKYPDTAYNNIGSIIKPMNYADACLCE